MGVEERVRVRDQYLCAILGGIMANPKYADAKPGDTVRMAESIADLAMHRREDHIYEEETEYALNSLEVIEARTRTSLEK